MNFDETVAYLYEQLPMYSRIGSAALKPNLDNTIALCEALGNPQHAFKSIHIAGTNGKGSTSHMLAAVLQKSGYKTGLYTSPHLVDFRERIRIDGEMVEKEWIVAFVEELKGKIVEIQPSFFEITVVMAFQYFAEQGVAIAVIETGMGGRLDSTNVITPLLSIITNIGLDHTDLLGDTLQKIAFEKAGIIKTGVPILIGEQQAETEQVFSTKALQMNASLYYAENFWSLAKTTFANHRQHYKAVNHAKQEILPFASDLLGKYQLKNIATALAAITLLNSIGMSIPEKALLKGLEHVKTLTGLRGRWDILQTSPMIVADVAHNPDGLQQVLAQWQEVEAAQKHVLNAMVKDKDVDKVLEMFPKEYKYHICNANIPRAMPAAELYQKCIEKGLNATQYNSVADALNGAKETMMPEDALLVTGSFFTVGEALAEML